jgi:hypothetical protein
VHAYGLHRYYLEQFVSEHFRRVDCAFTGSWGLKKNIIYDFCITITWMSRGVFQFYPMINLWYDIQIALQHKLPLLHLTAAPVLLMWPN